jgi:uncharacterized protein (DUF885 family)
MSASYVADIAERFWRFRCEEHPAYALTAGEIVEGSTLYREGPADYDRRRAFADRMRAELDGVEVSTLAPQARATVGLLHRELDAIIDHHDVQAHARPALFPGGPAYSAVHFTAATTVQDAAGARRYVDRLAGLPAFFKDAEANLEAGRAMGHRYPAPVLKAAVGALRSAIDGPVETLCFYAPLKRSLARDGAAFKVEAERAQRLLTDVLVPAFAAHADFVEALPPREDGPDGLLGAPRGRELYRVVARLYTMTDLEPEALHALGLSEIERLDGEISALAEQAGFGPDGDAFRRSVSADPQFVAASSDALRRQIEALAKRIDKHIPRLFGRLPRITYGIESIPEAVSARMPPAYAQPGPADRTAPGLFYVSGLPEKCPSYMHPALTLHEAWPGHLMHIALMQEMDDLPTFQRHTDLTYSAFLEGWALYCEGLGEEMGLYETPYQRFGWLDMEMWRALRLVVDTGIHWLGWTRAQAVDFMAARQSLSRATLEAEVDRYIALPGQALAYHIGNLKFRDLRARAEAALGDRFTLRGFHDAVMAAGAVTLPVLDDLMDDWLARTLAEAA